MWLCNFYMYQDEIFINYVGAPASYPIILEKSFLGLRNALTSLKLNNRRYMIITDTNVSKLYLDEFSEILHPISKSISNFVFKSGENSKNLDTIKLIFSKLLEEKFDREDILIALGGGVTGDIVGFAAATYLRGINFIQIPTTLLAMVDSSLGGKTGVDFLSYKNMIGAFHQPKLVYMNLPILRSLPQREINAGISESIKSALIKDAEYYTWLCNNREDIMTYRYDTIKNLIIKSCYIKKNIIEEDPYEKGNRALLNFGHTIGHAIEKLKIFTLLHGECIAIGMVSAAYISYKRQLISKNELDDIINSIKAYNLPTSVSGLSAEEIYSVTRLDKKMQANTIKFILLKEIGNAYIDTKVSKDEMLEAIRFIMD